MKEFIKLTVLVIACAFLLMALIATPAGIGVAIYEWAVSDQSVKIALWTGFKAWAIMLVTGVLVGGSFFGISKKLEG